MPALSKKAKARALKAEKKELQRLSSNYGSAGSAHLFRERFAQAEATAVPKYASYVCCLLGAYFGFRLCFDYFKLELLYAAIGVPFGKNGHTHTLPPTSLKWLQGCTLCGPAPLHDTSVLQATPTPLLMPADTMR